MNFWGRLFALLSIIFIAGVLWPSQNDPDYFDYLEEQKQLVAEYKRLDELEAKIDQQKKKVLVILKDSTDLKKQAELAQEEAQLKALEAEFAQQKAKLAHRELELQKRVRY